MIGADGSKGKIDKTRLENSKHNFQQGRADHFLFETLDLGEVEKIHIG